MELTTQTTLKDLKMSTHKDTYRPRHQIFLLALRNLLIAPFKLVFVIFTGIFVMGLIPALDRFCQEFFYQVILPFIFAFQRIPK